MISILKITKENNSAKRYNFHTVRSTGMFDLSRSCETLKIPRKGLKSTRFSCNTHAFPTKLSRVFENFHLPREKFLASRVEFGGIHRTMIARTFLTSGVEFYACTLKPVIYLYR